MYKVKLLKAEEILCYKNLYLLEPMIQTMDDRLEWLSEREPESEGDVYDNWEEKCNELEEIIEQYNNCLNTIDCFGKIEEIDDERERKELIHEIEDAISEVKDLLAGYQATYGGISRLYLWVEE